MTIHSSAIRTLIREAYSRLVLTVIAVSLGIIALRPAAQPAPVHAQADYS